MRILIALAAALALLGFAAHGLVGAAETDSAELERGSGYVMIPADGRYGERVYLGSGTTTALAIASAFTPYLDQVTIAAEPEDLDTAKHSASSGGYDYLFVPRILHWGDRATGWSGRDRVAVQLSIMDPESGEVWNTTIIDEKSGRRPFGGMHPELLLEKPRKRYAKKLF